ncbi:MAG: hypothetical protein AB1490_01385 [Pseudomonadota bacterium]
MPKDKASPNDKSNDTIRRTVHFKFTLPGASEQMIAMIKSAAPMYQMFGDAKVKLLQNVDDQTRFIQVVEYDAPAALETSRQQIASDPRVQTYIQGWRAMFPGAIEIEVFQDV